MKKKLNDTEMAALQKKHGLIKVNLPAHFEEYQHGNGEGIWAIPADKEGANLARSDTSNNSYYYPKIKWGTRVLYETRGENRPVAVWDDLRDTKEAPKHREETLKRIMERC